MASFSNYKLLFQFVKEASDLWEYNVWISKIQIPLNWAWDIVDDFVSRFIESKQRDDGEVI